MQPEQEEEKPIEDCIMRRRIDVVHICNQLQHHQRSGQQAAKFVTAFLAEENPSVAIQVH